MLIAVKARTLVRKGMTSENSQQLQKQDLRVGDLIVFQIGEVDDDFSSPNKDCWGALKVLHLGNADDGSFSVSVKSGLWKTRPSDLQVCECPPLVVKRFLKLGTSGLQRKAEPLIFTTPLDCKIDLKGAQIVGHDASFVRAERRARRKLKADGHFSTIASIRYAPQSIDHEYRAEHDETNWKAEIEAYRAKEQRLRLEREKREKERLKVISLQVLSGETPFADWDDRTHIVPTAFTDGVRQKSREALGLLTSLGLKPSRKDVRQVLKDYVSWLNSFDGSFGYAIETEEREDLIAFVEELCWATKQKPLISEVDEWRNW